MWASFSRLTEIVPKQLQPASLPFYLVYQHLQIKVGLRFHWPGQLSKLRRKLCIEEKFFHLLPNSVISLALLFYWNYSNASNNFFQENRKSASSLLASVYFLVVKRMVQRLRAQVPTSLGLNTSSAILQILRSSSQYDWDAKSTVNTYGT